MGSHFLLQEIFPTQGLNLHCRQIIYCLSHQGNPEHIYPAANLFKGSLAWWEGWRIRIQKTASLSGPPPGLRDISDSLDGEGPSRSCPPTTNLKLDPYSTHTHTHIHTYTPSLIKWLSSFFRNSSLHLRHLAELLLGFPRGSDGEKSVCNAGDPGSILGLGILRQI